MKDDDLFFEERCGRTCSECDRTRECIAFYQRAHPNEHYPFVPAEDLRKVLDLARPIACSWEVQEAMRRLRSVL